MKSRNFFELFLRALAMPHHWFFWLRKRGRLKPADIRELFFNYVAIAALYFVFHGGGAISLDRLIGWEF